MESFLIANRTFALWGATYLVLGMAVMAAWSWRFRRLARAPIAAGERRDEAWRGVAGAAGWLAALAGIVLTLTTSGDINTFEAVAASDEIGQPFLDAIAAERAGRVPPVAMMFAVAVVTLAVGGWWSGAIAALRGEVRRG
jgi:hypothetical protein